MFETDSSTLDQRYATGAENAWETSYHTIWAVLVDLERVFSPHVRFVRFLNVFIFHCWRFFGRLLKRAFALTCIQKLIVRAIPQGALEFAFSTCFRNKSCLRKFSVLAPGIFGEWQCSLFDRMKNATSWVWPMRYVACCPNQPQLPKVWSSYLKYPLRFCSFLILIRITNSLPASSKPWSSAKGDAGWNIFLTLPVRWLARKNCSFFVFERR